MGKLLQIVVFLSCFPVYGEELCCEVGWNYSALDKPQGCFWRCVILPRDTSVLREHIAVKLDYRQQPRISDKIINLIFV